MMLKTRSLARLCLSDLFCAPRVFAHCLSASPTKVIQRKIEKFGWCSLHGGIFQKPLIQTPTKTTDINKENYRNGADFEFCHDLLNKHFKRYEDDPTTIDLTLDALSNWKLRAMHSIVSKHPNDPTCKIIANKVKLALVSRGAR